MLVTAVIIMKQMWILSSPEHNDGRKMSSEQLLSFIAYLKPTEGPGLRLRECSTWLGRGSFSSSKNLQFSRRQARIVYENSSFFLECHGTNPLYLVRCQAGNVKHDSQRNLCKGDRVQLMHGDMFYLANRGCLLTFLVASCEREPGKAICPATEEDCNQATPMIEFPQYLDDEHSKHFKKGERQPILKGKEKAESESNGNAVSQNLPTEVGAEQAVLNYNENNNQLGATFEQIGKQDEFEESVESFQTKSIGEQTNNDLIAVEHAGGNASKWPLLTEAASGRNADIEEAAACHHRNGDQIGPMSEHIKKANDFKGISALFQAKPAEEGTSKDPIVIDMEEADKDILVTKACKRGSDNQNGIENLDKNGPIPGMKSVVATVTGYNDNERWRLVRLIDTVGALYTGSLSPANTHLVCWTFSGGKYDLAKRLGTIIINHRWFEDCLKAGTRLPEESYGLTSGKIAGCIQWQVPIAETVLTGGVQTKSEVDEVELSDKQTVKSGRLQGECSKSAEAACNLDIQLSRSIHEIEINLEKKRRSECTYIPRYKSTKFSNRLRQKKLTAIAIGAAKTFSGGQAFCDDIEAEARNSMDIHNSTNINACEHTEAEDSTDIHNTANTDADAGTLASTKEVLCVICHEDNQLGAEGVLACGHKFCFKCIHHWACKAKTATCPLCKTPFDFITKKEANLPNGSLQSEMESIILIEEKQQKNQGLRPSRTLIAPTDLSCLVCQSRDTEDLLLVCGGCAGRATHTFCLDPPWSNSSSAPWLCNICSRRSFVTSYISMYQS